MLYPKRGVSELARMDPAAVLGPLRGRPGALPGHRRDGRGDQRQPARRARCRGEDRRQVDQPVRQLRRGRRARRPDQGQGRRHAARASRRRAAQLRAEPARRRPRAVAAPGGHRLARLGPRGRAHRVRLAAVPRAARPAVRVPGDGGARGRGRLRSDRAGPRYGHRAGLAGPARAGRVKGRRGPSPAPSAAAPATSPGLAVADRRRAGRLAGPDGAGRRRRERGRAVAGRPATGRR